MAKVQGPLMSMSASGTVGGSITFDKRGFVRNRVTPANPQTAGQGNVRQVLLAIQKALTVANSATIQAVKNVAPVSYRWNSFLLSVVLGESLADYFSSRAAYAALTAEGRTGWENIAVTYGITERSLPYASETAITPGLALFAVARALFRLGIYAINGTPDDVNYDPYGDAIADPT